MTSALRIALVYPDLLGTYGDRGNALVLAHRARARGIDATIVEVAAGTPLPDSCDIYLLGGGEESDGFSIGSDDFWLLTLDANGKHVSSRLYGTEADEEGKLALLALLLTPGKQVYAWHVSRNSATQGRRPSAGPWHRAARPRRARGSARIASAAMMHSGTAMGST